MLARMLGVMMLAMLGIACFSMVATAQTSEIDFETDVRPILNEHCIACHGGVKQAADVSFIHRDAALSVIEPGSPDDSEFIERIKSDDEGYVMPPPEHGAPLTAGQIETLAKWVEQGATWMQPWAYEKPVVPALPTVVDEVWCRQPLDRFVLASLESQKIKPAPTAPPEQWLRRATLDITGLPPTPAEVDAFLAATRSNENPGNKKPDNENREQAFEKVVDQLLAKSDYGERWASPWLDQVRYADSRGLGSDGRRNIWKYRDWVIQSLNEDMPFDEFTIKQIAGDLLPNPTISDRLATAGNRLTQSNDEGGTDDEEFRVGAVLDRVSTVWQAWQGITFGCVQCHSHPYDPISHEEFYKFSAFFNNSADCDLSEEWPVLDVPLEASAEARASELDQQIKRLQTSIWERESDLLTSSAANWQIIKQLDATANKDTAIKVIEHDGHPEFLTTDTLSSGTVITLTAELPESTKRISAIRMTFMPRDLKAGLSDSEWGFVLSHFQAKLINDATVKVSVQIDENDESDASQKNRKKDDSKTEEKKDEKNRKIGPIEEPGALKFNRVIIDEPFPFKDPELSLDPKNNDGFSAYTRIHHPRSAVFVLAEPIAVPAGAKLQLALKHNVFLYAAFSQVARRGYVAVSDQPVFAETLNEKQLVNDRAELAKLKSERKKIKSTSVPIMEELPVHLQRPTHVFIRGLFLTKGEEVQADVPASLPPLPDAIVHDRMALAKWLVGPDNPLTARVTINRIWGRLFGIGIVPTEEDFGSSGERATNQKLLDHLATRFQNDASWRMKTMIREIVLSSTYRQDSRVRPELIATDPSNRLLARGPRFRMPAEMVRDAALSASGLLTEKVGGEPVFPPIPAGVWKPFSGEKWATAKVGDPNRYRRSIYTFMKRSIPYPMFSTFDAPSREFCTPRRLRSNTPLQSLMTLNDTTFVECADALVKRMEGSSESLDDQLKFGFVAVASRYPTDSELATLRELGSDSMNSVASLLLNLDEITSK